MVSTRLMFFSAAILIAGCSQDRGRQNITELRDWTHEIELFGTSAGMRQVMWAKDQTFEGPAVPVVVAMPSSRSTFLEHVFDPQKRAIYRRIIEVDCDNLSAERFTETNPSSYDEIPQDYAGDPSWQSDGVVEMGQADTMNYCLTDWSEVRTEVNSELLAR